MSDAGLRPGEQMVALVPPSDAALRFIGYIETPFQTRAQCPRQGRLDGPECALVLEAAWMPALRGLDRFETVDVLYWLHQSRRDLVTQSPRTDGTTVGTFALRSPVRPNPIGLARAALVRIYGARVIVRGLDCLNGTPLLDIKPNRCDFTVQAPRKAADQL